MSCPEHGDFDHRCRLADRPEELPCPACGTASPRVLRLSSGQFLVPEHFRTTLPTTGMKTNAGQSGDWENLQRDFNKWDSGAKGLRDHLPKGGVEKLFG